ncbi:MAG: hypothetical protein JOY99_08800 [Sphingomonadaceae bacterium]|nr:hypothetical protein [Sphingomonadaceae bacterium]
MSDPLLILIAILLTLLSGFVGYQTHIFVVKRQIWWVTRRRGRAFNQLSQDQVSALLLYAVGRRVEFPPDRR